MAEFKLGRIRFVWKGAWTSSTTYYQDDVISLGGKIYICVVGHESQSDFFSDFDITPPKWNLVSDGQTWKGDWQTGTEYIYDDIVSYGARLYIANTIHTSAATIEDGLEADLAKWDIFAEGLDWKGNWSTDTRYRINDVVKYGGTTYVCNTLHTSAATEALGLEADQSNWDYFNQGLEYKATWTTETRYKINDVVRYGASLWICTTEHTSAADSFATNSDKFEKFVEGFQYENEWNYQGQYQPGDIVQYGGNQYISKTDNTNVIPTTFDNTDWDLFSEGFKFLGEWGEDSTGYEYKIGELVTHGGYSYVCIEDHTDQQPPNILYWKRLTTGLNWKGEWVDDSEYLLGDVVRYGDNSYVCILGHLSEGDDGSTQIPQVSGADNSRPDQDITGTYWHIIAVGTEQSVLTTSGDMVYYSGSAPTRLPIGLNGQVLTVNQSEIPEWAFVGSTEDVYYVAEHGVDEPAPVYGQSIDRPWKSIRYAAAQVEQGAKNPSTARLLEMNRRFIQREIVEWTDYQITNGLTPFTTDFDYNSAKCERDMGLIVDALVWDITHGGNVRSREAALAYINDTIGSPYLGQKTETVASITYGLEVIEAVLNQAAPTVNYQSTNGDNSTAVVDQWFDGTIEAESTLANITSLTGIITDAITAGVADNIPAREERTTLIKVSTGRYYEVLPIIVPALCCIMGDELRATNVQPRTKYNQANNLTPKGDVKYSFKALERMEAIIGDVVTGNAVSKTTGNTEIQSQEWPFAETAVVAPQVEKLARTIRRAIDDKLETKIETIYENAWDMSTPANGRSRDLFLLNKEFIQEEILAYIADQYPNILYSKTKCKRDVSLIMDSVAYDLTYGGNWASVEAGKAYFNGNTGTLQIDSSEKTATLAAYQYLKELMQTTGRNIAVSPLYQSETEQIQGTGGNVGASTIIGNVMDDLITVIRDGIANAPTITKPSYTDADITTIESAVNGDLSTIQEQTIDFINANFGTFTYNSAKERTDLSNVATDIAYDVALGTNYNAIFNGIAHNRPTGAYGIADSKTQTVGALRYIRDLIIDDLSDSTAITRVSNAYVEVVDIINNGNGSADTFTYPAPATLPTTDADAAFNNIEANKDFIIAEITAWIADQSGGIWTDFTYDSTKCERDVGYIVEAMKYDILYGGTMATTRIAESYFGTDGAAYPAGQTAQTSAAYGRLQTILDLIAREQLVTVSSTNLEIQTTLGDPGTATEGNALIAKMQIIIDVLDAGNTTGLPAVVRPNLSALAVSATLQSEKTAIDNGLAQNILDTIQYITDTYNEFVFNHVKCSRDIGLIFDAAEYDLALSTNFQSLFAALSYLRAPSANVLLDQKEASIAAFEFARLKIKDIITASGAGGATIAAFNNQVDTTWEYVDDIVLGGSSEGSNAQVEDIEVYNAIRQLEMNKDFMVAEVQAHVDNYFKDTVTETNASNNQFEISSTAWMEENMEIRFTNPDDSTDAITNAGLDDSITYFVKSIVDDTHFTISLFKYGSTTVIQQHNEVFDVAPVYDYNTELCTRDVVAYVDAMKWDLTWAYKWKREYTDGITFYRPGIYKTKLAARYYINSVIGSQEEDFYYMRNGTGLRLQTLDGLRGDLTPTNAYGTSRVTAGAYASLDPGWGPNDQRVWITSRSPYLQNNTTFGYAAVGQKIDGALHNGGNDSMVSNDFTQVISDGIGAWITNNGRAELVSVFTYYSHVGYLAENGGRIRATNGNNSYGTWGSVAEGVDADEVQVTGLVDNRTQYSATVSQVNTDNNQILNYEFGHAGNDYTEVAYDVFGAGDSEVVVGDEFRDDGVYRVRIEEVNDSSGAAGGSGYVVVGNTAQTGSNTGIFLAATDGNISSAYPGMKIYIVGGAGIGQYGIINTYNSGSKEATVIRESDGLAGWDHVVPGTPWVTPNSTSVYQVEPRIEFSGPTKTSGNLTLPSSSTWTDVKYIETSAEYVGLATTTDSDGNGATFDVIRNGSKYYVTLNGGGSGYNRLDTVIISGTSLDGVATTNDITITITTINSATGAIVDFDFTGVGQKGKFLAVSSTTASAVSVDGTTFTAETLPSAGSGVWSRIASGLQYDGSSTYKESVIVVVADGSNNVAYSADADTWSTSSLPGGMNTGAETRITFGSIIDTLANRFVAISSADRDVAYSDDGGQNWTLTTDGLSAIGFDSITYGAGVFVAIASGTTSAAWSNNGIVWNDVTLPGNAGSDITFGNGRFIALGGANGTMYSLDGKTWYDPERSEGTALTLNLTATERRIAYGHGMFVITSTDTDEIEYSEDGQVWTAYTLSGGAIAGGFNAVAFGNPQRTGQFVILPFNAGTGAKYANIGARAKGRASISNEQLFEVRLSEPGSGYSTEPTITVTDPNNINDVILSVRIGKGALANPTFVSRGSGYTAASADVNANASNGVADFFQDGQFVAVRRLTERPVPGSNVVFGSLPGQYFKLVNVVSFRGLNEGSYTAFLQLSPNMEIEDAPADGDSVEMRIRFSQVRLTGHDFLDIGTGNFVDTNYPGIPVNAPQQDHETNEENGGRVFYTATDQDGNFRVGDLFSVEQATGVATLNADAFNIAGLQELTLGEVTLGGNSASITEFSTDPFMTANSDTIVPTQRAVKAYIEAQIGGGGASLVVNSVTAGDIFIGSNLITSVSGDPINIKANIVFSGTVLGLPLAYNYFLRT